jgi:hypothetical protein
MRRFTYTMFFVAVLLLFTSLFSINESMDNLSNTVLMMFFMSALLLLQSIVALLMDGKQN